MSEDQADYITDALEMIGAGYDKAAIIERSRIIHGVGENGLEEYRLFGWVKMSAKFCAHIRKLRGAKLAIWLCLALNISENGECKLTQKELCAMTGYSHTEVIESVKELDEMGFLSVDRRGKKNLYQPVFVAKGTGNTPHAKSLVKKLDSTPADSLESSPSYINSAPTSIKKKKEVKTSAEKSAKPETPSEVKIFREVTSRYPNKVNYPDVVKIVQSISARLCRPATADDLRPFFAEWTFRGSNPTNNNWLSWAVTGVIPAQYRKPLQDKPKAFDAIQTWLNSKQEVSA